MGVYLTIGTFVCSVYELISLKHVCHTLNGLFNHLTMFYVQYNTVQKFGYN